MRNRIWMFCLIAFCAAPLQAQADLVLVVSADSGISSLSRDEVVNIFLGRYRKLPNGATAVPLDIDGDSMERRMFYQQLLGKPLAEINSYWSRLVFSGRTTPPEDLPSQQDVLLRVIHDPVAIGYIDRTNLNDKVKVVYELSR